MVFNPITPRGGGLKDPEQVFGLTVKYIEIFHGDKSYICVATLGSILDFSKAENLASFSLQDGASERLDYVENPTHPPPNLLRSALGQGCIRDVWRVSVRLLEGFKRYLKDV